MIEANDRSTVVSNTETIASYRKKVYKLGERVNKTTRAAIKFMLLCGLSYGEIADELDISEESVYLLDHRAF